MTAMQDKEMQSSPLDMALTPGCFHVVEASAGTGKTWLTTALALRMVAEEGIPIERILVLTFTRAATAELADRTRARLQLALQCLTAGNAPSTTDDAIDRLLRSSERDLYALRLREALASFDLAPISTIHGFCQRTLGRFSLEAGLEPRTVLMPVTTPLSERLVADHMAITWQEVSPLHAKTLEDKQYSAQTLYNLGRQLTGAVVPTLEPEADETTHPPEIFQTFEDALRLTRETIRTMGDACWAAYLQSGSEFLSRFSTAQAGAYAKLKRAVRSGNPALLLNKELNWFSEQDANKKRDLATFGGLPLMKVFTRLRAAAQGVSDASAPVTEFAHSFRRRWEALLAERGVITYESMLADLARALTPGHPAAEILRAALSSQYDAALIDEFQDTDSAQWQTLRTIFGGPDKRLVVVGDPKQAIYSFRGADISVYTAAKGGTGASGAAPMPTLWPLPINYRTDPRLLSLLNTLWKSSPPRMGAGVHYEPVRPHRPNRVRDWGEINGRSRQPLELRLVTEAILGGNPGEWVTNKQRLVDPIAEDCVRVCKSLIGTMRIAAERDAANSPDEPSVPIAPRHIAVLVRTRDHGKAVLRAMRQGGLNAVLSTRESVFASAAARWLGAWLDAVADAGREGPARILALTPLIGFAPLALGHAVLQQESSDAPPPKGSPAARFLALRRRLRRDAEAWPTRGFMSLFERFLSEEGAWARLRHAPSGERSATDLRQLIELLHVEERRERDGVAALAARLRHRFSQPASATEEGGADDAAQHLESDADAIRILTQHVSKGLEFPIVLLPYAWTSHSISDRGQPLHLSAKPDAAGIPRPRLNIAPAKHPSRLAAKEEAQKREDEEAMRLLYVSMTRPEHHLVIWVARTKDTDSGALTHRLDLPRDATPDAVRRAIHDHRARWSNIDVSDAGAVLSDPHPSPTPLTPAFAVAAPIRATVFGLRNGWLQTSYSALAHSATADLAGFSSIDALLAAPAGALAAPAAGAVLPRGGTVTGTFVHQILELVEFDRLGDDAELTALTARVGQEKGLVDPGQQAIIRALLPHWLSTPLDQPSDAGPSPTPRLPIGFSLGQLRRSDRLDELAFDLSLGRSHRIQLDALRAVFDAMQTCPDIDSGARAWAAALVPSAPGEEPPKALIGALQGVLNGSIDLVFRTQCDGQPVFWIADYKTNAIRGPAAVQRWSQALREEEGPPPEGAPWRDPLMRALQYTRPLLDWEMADQAYPLQTLLYTVALHRLLGQRLGQDYAYDHQVGGCLWLFLRGMGGVQTPRHEGQSLGVWRGRWPAPMVQGLDLALDGAPADDVRRALSDATPRSRP